MGTMKKNRGDAHRGSVLLFVAAAHTAAPSPAVYRTTRCQVLDALLWGGSYVGPPCPPPCDCHCPPQLDVIGCRSHDSSVGSWSPCFVAAFNPGLGLCGITSWLSAAAVSVPLIARLALLLYRRHFFLLDFDVPWTSARRPGPTYRISLGSQRRPLPTHGHSSAADKDMQHNTALPALTCILQDVICFPGRAFV